MRNCLTIQDDHFWVIWLTERKRTWFTWLHGWHGSMVYWITKGRRYFLSSVQIHIKAFNQIHIKSLLHEFSAVGFCVSILYWKIWIITFSFSINFFAVFRIFIDNFMRAFLQAIKIYFVFIKTSGLNFDWKLFSENILFKIWVLNY